MKRILLFIGVVFMVLGITAQECIYIIEKDSYYLQEKVVVAVGDVDSISFVAPSECMENGYEWVDLGLPSGLKWATCNVGATKPEEYGNYYAWGETSTKSTYDWSTYKWCNGSRSTMTKYNTKSSYGTVDNKTVLEPVDDAARANWGGAWRMPTYEEWVELRTNCTWTWTSDYNGTGVAGRIVTGPNGNSIFLPAAGERYGGVNLHLVGNSGYYWTSSLVTSAPSYVLEVGFCSSMVYLYGTNYFQWRYYGLSVRPVLK